MSRPLWVRSPRRTRRTWTGGSTRTCRRHPTRPWWSCAGCRRPLFSTYFFYKTSLCLAKKFETICSPQTDFQQLKKYTSVELISRSRVWKLTKIFVFNVLMWIITISSDNWAIVLIASQTFQSEINFYCFSLKCVITFTDKIMMIKTLFCTCCG